MPFRNILIRGSIPRVLTSTFNTPINPIKMNRKIVFVLLLVLSVAGCQKSPVSEQPTNAYSTGNYPQSLTDLNSILAPCYSNLRDPNMFGFNFLPKAMASLEHTADCNYNDHGSWAEMAAMNFSVQNSFVGGVWTVMYTGIKNCNTVLSAVKYYNANVAKPGDAEAVNAILGQAYFLRAYYYFELECFFGESYMGANGGGDKMGVPIFDDVPSTLDSTQKPRAKVSDVWAFIESDCQTAAQLLHGQAWTGNDIGRVTEWCADALLGKAYVFTQDWTNAKTALLNVINNSGKTLMPYTKYRDAFIGITANEFNEESLFELNIDQNAQGNYGVYGNNPNVATINSIIFCSYALGYDGTETGSNALGYNNEAAHDKAVMRFGWPLGSFNIVTNANYNSNYVPANSGYISPYWPKNIMDPAYKSSSLQVRTNQTADPRLWVNCSQPWVDSCELITGTWQYISRPNYFTPAQFATNLGWNFRKYASIFSGVNTIPNGQADGANLYLLRLADVYLLYAEACHNSSDDVDGLAYLNKVHRRAYGYDIGSASPVDYASFTDATSAATANDPVLGHNPLYYERWAELFNEGQWWFDVCRWQLGTSEAAYYVTAMNAPDPIVFAAKSYSWPIPLGELNSNALIVNQQNPGY
jgi:starch-binding outer membrane protein, SusD/RagB family